MDTCACFLYFILVLVILTVLQRLYDIHKKRLPGPIGLPFVGRLPFIIFNAIAYHNGDFYEALSCDGASYGDARFLRAGTRHILILSSFDTISEALVRQSEVFSDRPTFKYMTTHRNVDAPVPGSTEKVGGGLIYSNTQLWKENRRFALRVLREFGMGKNMLENKVQIECQSLVDQLKKLSSCPVNPNMHLTKAVSNIICQLVFGFRMGYEDPDFESQVTLMKEYTQSMGFSLFMPIFYPFFDSKLYFRVANIDRFGFLEKKLMDYMSTKIDIVQSKYDVAEEPSNYVEAFLKKSIEDENTPNAALFNHQQLIVAVADLFLAGTDTTSNTLNWAFICAAVHPEWQQQVHEELDQQLGDSQDVKFADRLRCPKTQAFLDESMRYCTIVPHNVEKEVVSDIWFKNARVSKNTYVIADIHCAHRNPITWKDPDQFLPSRFLNDKNEYQPSRNLISFSIGKRSCLGESLARVEIFLFFATVMLRFQVTLDEETKRKGHKVFQGSDGIVYSPKEHQLIFTERN